MEIEIFPISGVSHQGVDSLLESLWRMLHPSAEERDAARAILGEPS